MGIKAKLAGEPGGIARLVPGAKITRMAFGSTCAPRRKRKERLLWGSTRRKTFLPKKRALDRLTERLPSELRITIVAWHLKLVR